MRYQVKGKVHPDDDWQILLETDCPVKAIEAGLYDFPNCLETIVLEDGIEIPGTLAI
jgi:hypothetical protein